MSRMPKYSKILIASNNQHKIKEIRKFFKRYKVKGVTFITPKELGLDSPEETQTTFTGNAELKARYFGDKANMPALADDSGISIDALGGRPGVHTADWCGPNRDFKLALLKVKEELKKVGNDEKHPRAKGICALSFYDPKNGTVRNFYGDMKGSLNFEFFEFFKIDGFGFQPIFMPRKSKKSFSLLSLTKKIKISHRSKAFKKLLKSCF